MPPVTLLETPLRAETEDRQVVSNLCPFEPRVMQEFMQSAQAMQEFVQRESQAFRAVQSLNAMAAQAAFDFQRLAQTSAQATAGFQSLVQAATQAAVGFQPLTDATRLIKEEAERFQRMVSSLQADERLQRIVSSFRAQELLLRSPAIDFQRLADATRLIKIPEWAQARQIDYAALIKKEDERWQRALSSLQPLINPLKEENERLQRALRSFIIPERGAFERRMCADALAAFDHEPEEVQWVVTQVLRLPRPYLAAVWEVLRQGRWMGADKPLPYVRKAAQRIHARDATQNGSMFNSTLLSLDAPGPTGTLLQSTLHASCDPWPEHETRHDAEQRLEQQGLSTGLSPDALSLYTLRDLYGDHISRRTLPNVLQWSRQRVERAWREMCRKMGPRKKLG